MTRLNNKISLQEKKMAIKRFLKRITPSAIQITGTQLMMFCIYNICCTSKVSFNPAFVLSERNKSTVTSLFIMALFAVHV